MDGLKNEKYLLINKQKDECFGKKEKIKEKLAKYKQLYLSLQRLTKVMTIRVESREGKTSPPLPI